MCGVFGKLVEALKHTERVLKLTNDIAHKQWLTGAYCTLGQCYLLALEPKLGRRDSLLDGSRPTLEQFRTQATFNDNEVAACRCGSPSQLRSRRFAPYQRKEVHVTEEVGRKFHGLLIAQG